MCPAPGLWSITSSSYPFPSHFLLVSAQCPFLCASDSITLPSCSTVFFSSADPLHVNSLFVHLLSLLLDVRSRNTGLFGALLDPQGLEQAFSASALSTV